MDLSDDATSELPVLEAANEEEKRNYLVDSSLFKSYNSTSSDGKVSLVILKQPEKQHRARYHTEGSRGAVKDRGQNGFPTVQLRGLHPAKAAVLQVFVGSDTGTPIPHLYYQACKVSGKNSTPCKEMKKENTDVILIDMEPDKDRIVVCDCVGILKERHSDIEGKVPANKRVNWKKKTTKCRIVFRTQIEMDNGAVEVLQVVTDTISCTQLPGTPEILKMSMTTCSIEGGEELWIIGKNFLKDTEVVFKEDGGSSRHVWTERVKPIKEFFSNNHLIVNIPPFRDPNLTELVVVNIVVKCGSKMSEPRPLTFKPAQQIVKINNLAAMMNMKNIVHQPAAMKEEPLFTNNLSASRPTILEQIEERSPFAANVVPHVSRMSKKRRERKTPFSRTREQPDIDADEAMFDTVIDNASSTSLDRSGLSWSTLLQKHSRQTSADRILDPHSYRHQVIIPDDTTANTMTTASAMLDVTRSSTFVEDASNTLSEATNKSPATCFENLTFQTQQQLTTNQPVTFAGISKTGFKLGIQRMASLVDNNTYPFSSNADNPSVSPPDQQQAQHHKTQQQSQQPTQQLQQTQQQQPADNCSVGFENSESATISIKLPPSVLQNQQQLTNIVNTISKALQPQPESPKGSPHSNVDTSFSPDLKNEASTPMSSYSNPASTGGGNQDWQSASESNWNGGDQSVGGKMPDTNWLDAPEEEAQPFEQQKRQRVTAPNVVQQQQTQAPAWTAQTVIAADQSQVTWVASGAPASSVKNEHSNWSAQPTPIIQAVSNKSTYWNSKPAEDLSRTNESSNDSLKCTKWENINAKPLETWNPAPNSSWSAATEVSNAAWSGSEQAVVPTWSAPAAPMDSSATVLTTQQPVTVVSAEMTPVNPKEVSPMDVDEMLRGLPTSSFATSSMEPPAGVMSKMTTTIASNLSGGESVVLMSTYSSC